MSSKTTIGEGLVRKHFPKIAELFLPPPNDWVLVRNAFITSKSRSHLNIPLAIKVKTKRNAYEDTGFDIEDYQRYRQHKRFLVLFVDDQLEQIYGNWLHRLEQPYRSPSFTYPSQHQGIIYFPLASMRVAVQLPETASKRLAPLRRSEHDRSGRPCAVCGETNGYFSRATYVGAPDGGVPVHMDCLPDFYRDIEHYYFCVKVLGQW